jgi:subtilisin-like proprotein convertase family protein
MSNPAFSQFLRRWARAGRRPQAAPARRPVKLRVEEVEARVVPASLPTPEVVGTQQITFGVSADTAFGQPSAAADPTDPDNQVFVTNNGTYMIAYASTDGGQSWSPFFDNGQIVGAPFDDQPLPTIRGTIRVSRLQDPGIDRFDPDFASRTRRSYTDTTGASVAFDRTGRVYVTATEHNADRTSGAVVLYAFDFNDGSPTLVDLDPRDLNDGAFGETEGGFPSPFPSSAAVLYRWLGTDAALNPVVAANNNPPSFTDPETGRTVVDTLAGKAVYVAWNTNAGLGVDDDAPFQRVTNPFTIQAVGSSDNGLHFSTPVRVDTTFGSYYSGEFTGSVLPQITFAPATLEPDGETTPGQVTFTWQTVGRPADTDNDPIPGVVRVDTSSPDGGDLGRPAVTASGTTRQYLNAPILDAGTGDPNVPRTTTIPFTVDLQNAGTLGPADPITDLNFVLALIHANVNQLRIELESPAGDRVTLLLNRTNAAGDDLTPDPPFRGLPDQPNIGVRQFSTDPLSRNVVGTTFDDEAPRAVNEQNANLFADGSALGIHVRPDQFGFDRLRDLYAGRTAAELSGEWRLIITDFRNNDGDPPPDQRVLFVDVQASGYISNTGFGDDRTVPGVFVPPTVTDGSGTVSADRPVVSPLAGLGAAASFAYDATAGAFSPYSGRLYSAYTVPIYARPLDLGPAVLVDTDVYVRYSDDGGRTWSGRTRVSDDNFDGGSEQYNFTTYIGPGPDNFSDGNRWQFQPTVAVDPVTGTVVVTWYDARNDASDGRVATYIATSIDGGNSFSPRLDGPAGTYNDQVPSNQTWLNRSKTAVDAVTGRTVVLEPIPSNVTAFNVEPLPPGHPDINNPPPAAPNGLGQRQSLLVHGGRVTALWTGNLNAPGTQVFASRANIAAGPRVVRGDSGPVIAPATVAGRTYNDTFAADGTRRLDGFTVTFDRPIDAATFGPDDVEVRFRGPATPLGVAATLIPVAAVEPLAGGPLGPTTFFVRFAHPQSAIGTYSYAIGPNVTDRVRTRGGNPMDQNANAVAGEFAGDRFANPRPVGDAPFALPYVTNTLPLIIPGPYVVGSAADRPAGQPDTEDNLVLNRGTGILTVTFDRDIVPSSFTPGNIRRLIGPAGEIAGPFAVEPVEVNPITGGARTFKVSFPYQVLSGGYTFEFGTNPVDPNPNTNTIRAVDQPRLVAELAAGATELVVTFDRPVGTPGDVLRVTGPGGGVPGSVTLERVGGNDRQFVIRFNPGQITQSGQYVIEFSDGPTGTGGEPLRVPADPAGATASGANRNPVPALDINHNAGLELLRGGVPDPQEGEILATRSYATAPLANVAIPANGTAELALDVPDDFLVRQDVTNPNPALRRSIRLTLNVQFPNVPDLVGELVAPDGSTVLLFDGPGTQGDPNQNDFAGTVFDDQGTTPITAARPPFNPAAGVFNPQQPFGRLTERPEGPVSARGEWRVRITNRGARTGTIQNFALTLPFAVPGTGLGEAVADRFTAGFRIFTQDPSNPLSRQQWAPVGPASQNAAGNSGYNAGRVTALAVDPSDPSGNTVYAGGASGGVWKTTNFLTTGPLGPDWVPLTDLAPTFGLNIGSIAVFGRNGDTTRSVIIAATGEGDTNGVVDQGGAAVSSAGVGFLISVDGGATWRVLDSTTNVDAAGNYLPINSPERDRKFVGTVAFKVVIDPTPTPAGDLIIYAALSDGGAGSGSTGGGIWRSNDTGRTWTLVRAGQATDVFLAAASAPTFFNPTDPNLSRNLQIMYAAFRGEGVFFSPQAPDATSAGGPGALTRLDGGGQNPLFRDFDRVIPPVQIPIAVSDPTNPARSTPSGNKGRISLAGPALTNDVIRNVAYQGWLYALVSEAGGDLNGLYMTKDFGRNWTRVRLSSYVPLFGTGPYLGRGYGSNDVSGDANHPEYDPFTGLAGSVGNFAQALAVDPNNPNVVYLGGSNQFTDRQPIGGFLRVDTTRLEDTQNVTAYNNSLPNTLPEGRVGGGPRLMFGSPLDATPLSDPSRFTGSVVVGPYNDLTDMYDGPGGLYGIVRPDDLLHPVNGFLNVFRNPASPFESNATLFFSNVDSRPGGGFQNRGFGARIQHIAAEVESNVHRILTTVDPLTGLTRLIVGDDQGVASVVDAGDGSLDDASIGFAAAPPKRRNGDLQIGQFYQGASQPSQLAADIAGVRQLFYATSNNNGFPASPNTILQDGSVRDWEYVRAGSGGSVGFSGTGVATDQTGTGVVYQYRWPGPGSLGAFRNAFGPDFFRVILPGSHPDGVGRTNGLVQDRTASGGVSDDPLRGVGQWPAYGTGANFAVNPINGNAVVMSAPGFNQGQGRLFRTTDQGVNWFVIGETPQVVGAFGAPGQFGPGLDGTYAPAVAFGAPNPAQPTLLDNFIYAGTTGGRVFVTRTGAGPWLNITAAADGSGALDGSAVQKIVTNPRRGSTDAFAVTLRGVYYKADAFDTGTGWVDITGNLFGLAKPALPNPANPGDNTPTLKYLTTIAADWRFANQDPEDPARTFPVLYVGGEGGVYRSTDFGANWDYFPAASTYTDLATGRTYDIPDGGYLPNAHVTDLDLVLGNIDPANGLPRQSESGGLNLLLATTYGRGQFAIRLDPDLPPGSFVSGPRVAQLINPNPVGGPSDRFRVVFSGPVNPATFGPEDVRIAGPGGVVPVLSVTPVGGGTLPTTFDIVFGPVTDARTSLDVLIGADPSGPDGAGVPRVTDLGGFAMNQDGDMVNGEPVVDQYRTTIVVNGTTNNRLVVTSAPATAVAGVPVTVTVEARDANDLPITGLNGRLDLTAAPGTGPFSPTQVSFVNGRATFEVTFTRSGPQTVRVALAASGVPANATAFTVDVSPAAATAFEVTPPSTVLTVGVNDPNVTFQVRALDPFGNLTPTYNAPVSVTLAGAGGSVPAVVDVRGGTATFTGTFTAQGTTTVTVTGVDPVAPAGTISGSATVAVNSGTAARLELTPRGSGPFVIGQSVTVDVRAVDAAGNTADFDGPFTASIGEGATATPGTFVDGLATVVVTFEAAGTYTLVVDAGSLTGTAGPLTALSAPPRPSPTEQLPGITAVGTGMGGTPVVQVFNEDGTLRTQVLPFPPGFNNEVDPAGLGFTGGNRVAVGDVTGDGVPDYVIGTGPSITAFVQVVDGATNQPVQNIQPFEDFKGGVFVAVGDVDGDGVADIVVTPDLTGGPRVSVYRGGDFRRIANFFGINDPNFRGGARAAVGDLNNDGFADVVVSAGFGGGPRISVYDGAALARGRQVNPVGDFFLFEPELRNGAYVAVGDVDGDGFADIIGGAGPGGAPRVLTISGRALLTEGVGAAFAAPVANFFAGDIENRGGIRVTAKNLDDDRFADVVVGAGEGGGSGVTAYSGASLAAGGADVVYALDALDGYTGGVFVG